MAEGSGKTHLGQRVHLRRRRGGRRRRRPCGGWCRCFSRRLRRGRGTRRALQLGEFLLLRLGLQPSHVLGTRDEAEKRVHVDVAVVGRCGRRRVDQILDGVEQHPSFREQRGLFPHEFLPFGFHRVHALVAVVVVMVVVQCECGAKEGHTRGRGHERRL